MVKPQLVDQTALSVVPRVRSNTIKNKRGYFTVKPHVHVLSNAPNGGKIQLQFNQHHGQKHFLKVYVSIYLLFQLQSLTKYLRLLHVLV